VQTGNVLKTKMMPQVVLLPIGKILRTHAYFGVNSLGDVKNVVYQPDALLIRLCNISAVG